MQEFQNILVVQSADQAASASLETAIHLAQSTGCRVKVVDVHEPVDAWLHEINDGESDSASETFTDRQTRLNEIVDQADFPDDVTVKLLQGRPINVLIDEMRNGHHDLVLKDAVCEATQLFLGSLDMRLIQMSPVPLWISNATAKPKLSRILATIDPHVATAGKDMNERVIRLASMLAGQEQAELYVVGGWDCAMPPDGGIPADNLRNKSLRLKMKQHAWANIEEAIRKSTQSIPADNIIFEQGSGTETILAAVINVQPDLLVMGSVTHVGIPGVMIGNTAEQVTRQIECSLLTLKPNNFSIQLP